MHTCCPRRSGGRKPPATSATARIPPSQFENLPPPVGRVCVNQPLPSQCDQNHVIWHKYTTYVWRHHLRKGQLFPPHAPAPIISPPFCSHADAEGVACVKPNVAARRRCTGARSGVVCHYGTDKDGWGLLTSAWKTNSVASHIRVCFSSRTCKHAHARTHAHAGSCDVCAHASIHWMHVGAIT